MPFISGHHSTLMFYPLNTEVLVSTRRLDLHLASTAELNKLLAGGARAVVGNAARGAWAVVGNVTSLSRRRGVGSSG